MEDSAIGYDCLRQPGVQIQYFEVGSFFLGFAGIGGPDLPVDDKEVFRAVVAGFLKFSGPELFAVFHGKGGQVQAAGEYHHTIGE